MLISNRLFLWQLFDLVVRFASNLIRLYKSESNTTSVTFVEITQKTKKLFILNVDSEPIVPIAAI